ncbi:hypothetical protein EVAR_95108_1 [Eumeta japonica]|uniref:Uncharacterized protein n=1 Tax=Eumeta variegata TaxID=151549 RepID=A0A4C1TC44_EUMVA|nr:hypothetical protein EVAR_95108_1 [Eumeta japonica]
MLLRAGLRPTRALLPGLRTQFVFMRIKPTLLLTIVYIGHIYIFTISSIHEVIRNSRSRAAGRRDARRLGGSVRCTHAGRATKVSRIRRQRMVATTGGDKGRGQRSATSPRRNGSNGPAGNRLCGPGRGRRPQAQGK